MQKRKSPSLPRQSTSAKSSTLLRFSLRNKWMQYSIPELTTPDAQSWSYDIPGKSHTRTACAAAPQTQLAAPPNPEPPQCVDRKILPTDRRMCRLNDRVDGTGMHARNATCCARTDASLLIHSRAINRLCCTASHDSLDSSYFSCRYTGSRYRNARLVNISHRVLQTVPESCDTTFVSKIA